MINAASLTTVAGVSVAFCALALVAYGAIRSRRFREWLAIIALSPVLLIVALGLAAAITGRALAYLVGLAISLVRGEPLEPPDLPANVVPFKPRNPPTFHGNGNAA